MYDFPVMLNRPQLPIIHSMSRECVGARFPGVSPNSMASSPWPTPGKGFFLPFVLTETKKLVKGYYVNGTSPSGSWDVGVYDATCTKLLGSTGSVFCSGARAAQLATISVPIFGGSPVLTPGLYYMACAAGSAPTNIRLSVTAVLLRRAGVLEQTSSLPLPSTRSPVAITAAYLPSFGLIFDPRS